VSPTNQFWKWDFSTTCKQGQEITYTPPGRNDNETYHIQLCGTTVTWCTSPPSPYPTGSVVQTYMENGAPKCEVLGRGAPVFTPFGALEAVQGPETLQLVQPMGLNLTFRGTPADEKE
jgi:hypothetical protein